MSVRVAVVNPCCDPLITDPEELLDRLWPLTAWAGCLAGAGAAVTVVQGSSGDHVLERGGVRYELVGDAVRPVQGAWRAPRRMVRRVAGVGADVVHLNGLMFSALAGALRAALEPATALVLQHHAEAPSRRLGWLQRRGLTAADGFLFTGRAAAAPFRAAGVIRSDQPVFEVMEVPVERPSSEPGRQSPDLEGAPVILWVGHLDANKDPLTVLDGLARVSGRLPRARLYMVYRGAPLLDQVRTFIDGCAALRGRVTLLGALEHDQIGSLCRRSDLFVLGSRREGSGLALAESLAAGALPVVTDIPTFRWMTADGAVGQLWPPGDAAACARALERAAAELGAASRRAAGALFADRLGPAAVARDALAAYRAVLAARPVE